MLTRACLHVATPGKLNDTLFAEITLRLMDKVRKREENAAGISSPKARARGYRHYLEAKKDGRIVAAVENNAAAEKSASARAKRWAHERQEDDAYHIQEAKNPSEW